MFTSLAHLVNGEFLGDCYRSLGKERTCGIDGRSWQEYGEQLDANLTDLVARLKATGCRPHLLHIPLANFPYHRGGKSYIVLLPAWL